MRLEAALPAVPRHGVGGEELMGYPMMYRRVVIRNYLQGGYDGASALDKKEPVGKPQWGRDADPPIVDRQQYAPDYNCTDPASCHAMIAGDLRRLEADQRDERHLAHYADQTGLTPDQVKAVLDLFFGGDF